MTLTEKQKAFCHEYIVDLNAAAAYKRAGYSVKENAARAGASTLLTNPNIQVEIQRLQELRARRTDITADRVLTAIGAIAFTPITNVIKVSGGKVVVSASDKWTPATKLAVESIRQSKDGITIKMHNKVDALGKLMQHLGMLSDLNIAIATLKTYGEVEKTNDGYRVILHAENSTADQSQE